MFRKEERQRGHSQPSTAGKHRNGNWIYKIVIVVSSQCFSAAREKPWTVPVAARACAGWMEERFGGTRPLTSCCSSQGTWNLEPWQPGPVDSEHLSIRASGGSGGSGGTSLPNSFNHQPPTTIRIHIHINTCPGNRTSASRRHHHEAHDPPQVTPSKPTSTNQRGSQHRARLRL